MYGCAPPPKPPGCIQVSHPEEPAPPDLKLLAPRAPNVDGPSPAVGDMFL